MTELENLTIEEMREANLPPFIIVAELDRRHQESMTATTNYTKPSWWQRLLKWWRTD